MTITGNGSQGGTIDYRDKGITTKRAAGSGVTTTFPESGLSRHTCNPTDGRSDQSESRKS
jgi:hypothetical protein